MKKESANMSQLMGTLVQKGQYDLVGPSGEMISPPLWEAIVKAGMEITIRIWLSKEQSSYLPPPPPVDSKGYGGSASKPQDTHPQIQPSPFINPMMGSQYGVAPPQRPPARSRQSKSPATGDDPMFGPSAGQPPQSMSRPGR
ncbi:hypothetical protein B0T22DRAFT_160816 [Podospora appendiculata]|uniref:Ubiquitin-like domain-containing protein n=1 Tax=Podospora appendiculata TaxID=314037 RepID=A0AAE0X9U0_9PEZI|nr:hypothetical protein B0T22DRAFT_160816 [Podospora appendiculata]